ncbi:hypothetical protein [Pseudoclavibacter sp. JSM 162008]|uniref:hypothetical protein n=1 Tax=Pseudoclavibacter sp. JSM 162008 TaxID=3229855 RepID=UPI003526BD8D
MAIVRNKKPQAADPSAIAAFGAAADATPEQAVPVAPKRAPRKEQPDGARAPASSLVRWEKNEALRDGLMDYAKQRRYPVHTVLLMALELGLEQLDERSK